ncbi:MAG: hypothetical protein Q4A74_04055 [Cardiobacteriaceae bacterium]|nr:hypothetical protein [Cardiobacteriaceae bacterium]
MMYLQRINPQNLKNNREPKQQVLIYRGNQSHSTLCRRYVQTQHPYLVLHIEH